MKHLLRASASLAISLIWFFLCFGAGRIVGNHIKPIPENIFLIITSVAVIVLFMFLHKKENL